MEHYLRINMPTNIPVNPFHVDYDIKLRYVYEILGSHGGDSENDIAF
jgi:hypothetical protein